MTAQNSNIMKVVLSLLAVVSIVLIIVFAAGGGGETKQEENYEDLYVEDGEDALGNQELDDIYWDDSNISDGDFYVSDGDIYDGEYSGSDI